MTYTGYPASACSCVFKFRGALKAFNITASADSDSFVCTIPDTVSATLEPGDLHYAAYVTDTESNVTVPDAGCIIVKPNPSVETYAQRALAAIRARIEDRATDDQLTTRIDGLELRNMTPAELIKWDTYFSALVKRERDTMHRAAGLGGRNKTYVRFG